MLLIGSNLAENYLIMDCKECKDTYYIIGPNRPGRIRSITRCSCKGSRRNLTIEWLNDNKQYIHTAIQNEDITRQDVINILIP